MYYFFPILKEKKKKLKYIITCFSHSKRKKVEVKKSITCFSHSKKQTRSKTKYKTLLHAVNNYWEINKYLPDLTVMCFGFASMNQIGKLDGILNEKHRDVVSNLGEKRRYSPFFFFLVCK